MHKNMENEKAQTRELFDIAQFEKQEPFALLQPGK